MYKHLPGRHNQKLHGQKGNFRTYNVREIANLPGYVATGSTATANIKGYFEFLESIGLDPSDATDLFKFASKYSKFHLDESINYSGGAPLTNIIHLALPRDTDPANIQSLGKLVMTVTRSYSSKFAVEPILICHFSRSANGQPKFKLTDNEKSMLTDMFKELPQVAKTLGIHEIHMNMHSIPFNLLTDQGYRFMLSSENIDTIVAGALEFLSDRYQLSYQPRDIKEVVKTLHGRTAYPYRADALLNLSHPKYPEVPLFLEYLKGEPEMFKAVLHL